MRDRARVGLRRRAWPAWPLIMAALVVAAIPRTSRAVSTFTVIPEIPAVALLPEATAISANGQVVVGSQFLYPEYGSNYEGFRWTEAGGTVPLGGTPGILLNTYPQTVSADGSVVAGYTAGAGADAAFRWTEPNGVVSIGTLPGTLYSIPRSVSGEGGVVVGTSYNASCHNEFCEAFRWTEVDGMVGLGDLPGGWFASYATGVSADGAVVVGHGTTANDGLPHAFRWTEAGGMVGLGTLPGEDNPYSRANAVSADGRVIVGGSSSTGFEAFLWTKTDGMIGLGDLTPGSGFSSEALAVSADGSVVVGLSEGVNVILGPTGTVFSAPGAFVWDATHGMRSIQELLESDGIAVPFDLYRAIDVSADGTVILGTSEVGFYPNLSTVSWIATIPSIPEPSTALLLMSGLFALARQRARHLAPANGLRGRDRAAI